MIDLFDPVRQCKPILGFFGEYRFLSNYHLCDNYVDGNKFKSSEHAYMYQKSFDEDYRLNILNAATPKEAKRIGSAVNIKLRSDWNSYRIVAMHIALQAKFRNQAERNMLLATCDAYLEETNTWGDRFWGVCGGVGENRLGHILMKIRDSYEHN